MEVLKVNACSLRCVGELHVGLIGKRISSGLVRGPFGMLTDGAGRALLTGKQEASGDQHHKRDPGQNRFGTHVHHEDAKNREAFSNQSKNPSRLRRIFGLVVQMHTDLCSSVFICGSVLCSSSKSLRGPRREHGLQPFGIGGDPAAAPAHNLVLYAEDHRGAAQVQSR